MNRNGAIRAVMAPLWIIALTGVAVETSEAQAIKLKAKLIGFQEVPSVLTTALGEFSATVDPSRTSMTYTLTYSGLLGDATQSHIHFGQRGVNGGVMVFFCTGVTITPRPGVPTCPLREGTVTGTVMAADVVGPTAQGVNPGNFDDLISAIQSGQIYTNVHSTRWPGGEIRGQVKVSGADK